MSKQQENPKRIPNRKSNGRLNVTKVMEDFQKSEESSSHRKGTFKIGVPFDKALDTILKSKPDIRAKKEAQDGPVRRPQ